MLAHPALWWPRIAPNALDRQRHSCTLMYPAAYVLLTSPHGTPCRLKHIIMLVDAAVPLGMLAQSKIGAGNAGQAVGHGAVVYGQRRTSSSLLLDGTAQVQADT
jgi:hypothetical protein